MYARSTKRSRISTASAAPVSVMAQPASRRAVISATYDSGEALDRNRDAARSLRTTRLRDLGAEQIDICEFELAIARLRVPEMA